jgi:hypothetical protein
MISVHCTLYGILKATGRLLIAVRLAIFAHPFMAWYIFNKNHAHRYINSIRDFKSNFGVSHFEFFSQAHRFYPPLLCKWRPQAKARKHHCNGLSKQWPAGPF